jgi:CheY-like chemotaxis protein
VCLGERSVGGGSRQEAVTGARVLVADDDEAVRSLYVALLREVAGISSLVDASDGHEAVLIARRRRCRIAILDFNMPRLDGVEAALLLRRDCPSTRVAVQSSDPDGLKERAAGLGLAVFDKLDVESLLAWVERQAAVWNGLGSTTVAALAPRRDVSCSQCGYGVVSREPPKRCRCATTALRGKLLYPRRRTGASADSANARRYVTPQTVRRPRESCRRCRGRGRHGVREGQRDGQ